KLHGLDDVPLSQQDRDAFDLLGTKLFYAHLRTFQAASVRGRGDSHPLKALRCFFELNGKRNVPVQHKGYYFAFHAQRSDLKLVRSLGQGQGIKAVFVARGTDCASHDRYPDKRFPGIGRLDGPADRVPFLFRGRRNGLRAGQMDEKRKWTEEKK